MINLVEIQEKIAALNFDDRIYDGIDLTREQHTFERGKPKKYLELACDLFKLIEGKTIVEIGCMRIPLLHDLTEMRPECCNDGHSTCFWCSTGAQVYSIDIDKQAVAVAKESCKKYRNCKILRRDGLGFLKKYSGTIDLLYLDAWDVAPGTNYAENHLLAYLAAKPKLNEINIISIDDTDIGRGGKGRLLLPVLKADDYTILVTGRQTVAIKLGTPA